MNSITRHVISNNSITKYSKKNKYSRRKNTYKNGRFRQKAGAGDDDPSKKREEELRKPYENPQKLSDDIKFIIDYRKHKKEDVKPTKGPMSFIERGRNIRANNIAKIANTIETFDSTKSRPEELTDYKIKSVVEYYKRQQKAEEERAAREKKEEEERALRALAEKKEEEERALRALAEKKEEEERVAREKKEEEERVAEEKREEIRKNPLKSREYRDLLSKLGERRNTHEKLLSLFMLVKEVSTSDSIFHLQKTLKEIIEMPKLDEFMVRRKIMKDEDFHDLKLNELRKHSIPKLLEEINKLLPEDINEVDSNGLTLLDYAISIGNSDIVSLLIDKGADVNVEGNRYVEHAKKRADDINILKLINSKTRNLKSKIAEEAQRQLEKRQNNASRKIQRLRRSLKQIRKKREISFVPINFNDE